MPASRSTARCRSTAPALLGCAVTTGAGAIFNAAEVTPGETVCVIGCGGIGLAAINAAKIAGAGKIIALDPVPEKRALAEKLGATHTLDALADDRGRRGRRAHRGRRRIMRSRRSGGRNRRRLAVKVLRRGGTATILGMMPLGEKVGAVGARPALRARSCRAR